MNHHVQSRPPAMRPIPLEVEGEPVGVLIATDAGYRFLAVRLAAFGSDGRVFPSPEAAQRAVAEDVFGARN